MGRWSTSLLAALAISTRQLSWLAAPIFYGREGEAQLADVNGDGLTDLLLVDRYTVQLWLNQASTGFGPDITLNQVPEYIAGETILRLADMDGDGATELLYSTYPAAEADTFRYPRL